MTDSYSMDSFMILAGMGPIVCDMGCSQRAEANTFPVERRDTSKIATIGDHIRAAEKHLVAVHGGKSALEEDGALSSLDVLIQLETLAIILRVNPVRFDLRQDAGNSDWVARFIRTETGNADIVAQASGRIPTEAIAKLIEACHGG
jgi:hypothetical protein